MENLNVHDYLKEAKELENLFENFVEMCDVGFRDYVKLSDSAKPIQRELLKRYEIWFAVTKLIVRQYSDRLSTFEGKYPEIKNYILIQVSEIKKSFQNNFID